MVKLAPQDLYEAFVDSQTQKAGYRCTACGRIAATPLLASVHIYRRHPLSRGKNQLGFLEGNISPKIQDCYEAEEKVAVVAKKAKKQAPAKKVAPKKTKQATEPVVAEAPVDVIPLLEEENSAFKRIIALKDINSQALDDYIEQINTKSPMNILPARKLEDFLNKPNLRRSKRIRSNGGSELYSIDFWLKTGKLGGCGKNLKRVRRAAKRM